jgi:SnoaL-like domain
MDVEAAARAWIDAWDRAWHAKNPAPLAAVYAENVVFRSHPFREPQSPLVYARSAFDEEGDELDLWWNEPIAVGERAVVEWWATLSENGEPVTLAGASVLTFQGDGRVIDQHDYWAIAPGHARPWPEWAVSARP